MFGNPYDPDVSVKGLYAYLAGRDRSLMDQCDELWPPYKGWPAAGRPERFVRVV